MAAGNKITAHFGADVSEVEAKMMQATRATKYYENAVKQVNKAEAMSSGGGFMGQIGKRAPQLVSQVKGLAGALGAAGAAAGLVPGLGMAAIGVAAVVAGVKKIREYYANAAESAKNIADYMTRAGARNAEKLFDSMGDEQKLKSLTDRAKELRMAWEGAVAARLGDDEILKRREAYDIAEIARAKQAKEVAESRADAEEKAKEKRDRARLWEFNLLQDAAARNKEVADAQADAAEKIADAQQKIADQKKKADEEEAERVKKLAEMRYDAAWEIATFEQRLTQVVKEGREAQAKAEKNASTENLIALEEAKKKYRDLIKELKEIKEQKEKDEKAEDKKRAKKSDKKTRGREDKSDNDGGRNEEGRFTNRSGRIVSDEDRARTEATRRRDKEFDDVAKSQRIKGVTGEVGKDMGGKKVMGETEKLLAKIESYLKPTK